MTSRQRIKAAVEFQQPDRLPVGELFWDGTFARWRKQGMPAEVSAEDYFGLDLCTVFLVSDLRRTYRNRLAFYGNIAVANLIAADKGPLLAEIRAKAPLAREGGYIFGSDHSIPPQVDLARYRKMLATARACYLD